MIYSIDNITPVQVWFYLLAPFLLMMLWTFFLNRYAKNSTPRKYLKIITYFHLVGFLILTTFIIILPYKTKIYIHSDLGDVLIKMNEKSFKIHSGDTILHTRFWGEKAPIKLTQNAITILSDTIIAGCTVINLSEKKGILIEELSYARKMPFGIKFSSYEAPSPDIVIHGISLYNIGSNYENIYGFNEFPPEKERNYTGKSSQTSYNLKIIRKENYKKNE